MLRLNLVKIRAAQEHIEEHYPPDVFAADADTYTVTSPVALAFDVYKDKDQFRLAGRVRATLELPCSRCLEGFAWPADAAFDLRYQPRSEPTGDAEREIGEDDFSSAYYDDDSIDLVELMREQLQLAVPMKPLCREDCLGLCPHCGTNLNRGTCACKAEWDDPRLAVLKTLKKES